MAAAADDGFRRAQVEVRLMIRTGGTAADRNPR
jgi:hypothetical protein